MRKGERDGGRQQQERGQGGGIYMTGAIGYGELSWIKSLFTLAGRLPSEAGEDGASGDPRSLLWREEGWQTQPQMTGRNVTWNNGVTLHNGGVHHH